MTAVITVYWDFEYDLFPQRKKYNYYHFHTTKGRKIRRVFKNNSILLFESLFRKKPFYA